MTRCDLCDLPTPDEPVTGDGAGRFCCRGCLRVHEALGDATDVDPAAVRDRVGGDVGQADSRSSGTPDDVGDAPVGVASSHEEAFLTIDGLHCTSCEAFLELRGERTDGIDAVAVSYATDAARVTYDPDAIDERGVADALSGNGYDARLRGESAGRGRDAETVQRLLVGGVVAMLVMPWYVFYLYPSYVGIETGVLDVDATTSVGIYFPFAAIGLLTAIAIGYTGRPILRGAYVSLVTRRPNMDLLVSVAVLAAFGYSTVALATGGTHLYYDVSVAIVLVVTLGTYYEESFKRRANGVLADLTRRRDRTATRFGANGETEPVAVEDLDDGDRVIVPAGDRIPVGVPPAGSRGVPGTDREDTDGAGSGWAGIDGDAVLILARASSASDRPDKAYPVRPRTRERWVRTGPTTGTRTDRPRRPSRSPSRRWTAPPAPGRSTLASGASTA